MASRGDRRLAHLVRCTGERTKIAMPLDAADSAVSDSAATIRPLSMSQLKQFIRDGYLVMQIDGVPEGFHERVFAKAHVSRAICCLLSVMARCIAC